MRVSALVADEEDRRRRELAGAAPPAAAAFRGELALADGSTSPICGSSVTTSSTHRRARATASFEARSWMPSSRRPPPGSSATASRSSSSPCDERLCPSPIRPRVRHRHFVDDPSGAPELVVSTPMRSRRSSARCRRPIVIDHDLDRVVGHVRDLYIADDVDYGTRVRKWWFASCELTDAPGWLKRGGGVSWAWKPLAHPRDRGDDGGRPLPAQRDLTVDSEHQACRAIGSRLPRHENHRRRFVPPTAPSPVRPVMTGTILRRASARCSESGDRLESPDASEPH